MIAIDPSGWTKKLPGWGSPWKKPCVEHHLRRRSRRDDLAADVPARSGHQDHQGASTRASPPLTSSTASVTCGFVIRNSAAWAMSSGCPIRPTGIAAATRRRRSSRSASGPHLTVGVAGADRVDAQRTELERQRAREALDRGERGGDHRRAAPRGGRTTATPVMNVMEPPAGMRGAA
jgi:hypothetical protein